MKIYVTGLGVVSGIGIGVSENIEALRQRKHGIGKITLFPTALDVPVSEVKRSNEELKKLISLPPQRTVSRTALLGMIAAEEAMKDAGLTPPLRIGFISATSVGGMDLSEHFYESFKKNPGQGRLQRQAPGQRRRTGVPRPSLSPSGPSILRRQSRRRKVPEGSERSRSRRSPNCPRRSFGPE